MGSQNNADKTEEDTLNGEENHTSQENGTTECETETNMVEEPRNGSIVLNATDLEVIAAVEKRLREIDEE